MKHYTMKPIWYLFKPIALKGLGSNKKFIRRSTLIALGASNLFTWPLQLIDCGILLATGKLGENNDTEVGFKEVKELWNK